MLFQSNEEGEGVMIDSYVFGQIVIDKILYEKDVIVSGSRPARLAAEGGSSPAKGGFA